MFDILQLLAGSTGGSYVESGILLSGKTDGRYTVSINGKSVSVESTVPAAGLLPGTRVVINRTSSGRYIIGTSRQFSTQNYNEVIIDG